MDFFVADFSKGGGDNVKDILSKAGKEFSVILTVEELEKMASDEKYEKEYMEKVQDARRMSEQINKEYGATSVSGEAANRTKVSKIGISINENGTTAFFAERKKQTGQTMMVQADSIEELRESLREANWNKAAE